MALALTSFVIVSCGGLAGALGSGTIEVYPNSKTVELGKEFSVDIVVSATVPVTGVQFDLRFDQSVLRVTKVEKGNIFSEGFFQVIGGVNNTTGTVSDVVDVSIGPSTTTGGVVAKVYFETVTKGSSQIILENVIVGDENASNLSVSVRSGTVYVIEPVTGDNQPSENTPSSQQGGPQSQENRRSAAPQSAIDITIPLMAGLGLLIGSIVSLMIFRKRTTYGEQNKNESIW